MGTQERSIVFKGPEVIWKITKGKRMVHLNKRQDKVFNGREDQG